LGLSAILDFKVRGFQLLPGLQLEAARRRAVLNRFNFIACAKFELAQPIRCRLRAFFSARTLRYGVTLNFDPVTLTFDLEHL